MSELIKKIVDDMQQTGFPLELRVARMFGSRDYYVATNVYFVDKDEEKGREIDMRTLKNAFFKVRGRTAVVRHCLLIECKKSASHPWIFCVSPDASYDPTFTNVLSNGVHVRGSGWFEFGQRHPWFGQRDRGRSFFEAFTKGNDRSIQQAILASIKACIEAWESKFAGEYEEIYNAIFYYPVVIVDGELFVAHLEGSALSVEPADQVVVSVHYRSPRYQRDYKNTEYDSQTVLVVRESFLPKAVDALDEWLVACAKQFESENWFAPLHRKTSPSSRRKRSIPGRTSRASK